MKSSLIESDLIRDEGKRGRVYIDTLGHSTIGVGHNLDAAPLCDEAILAQLRWDIAVAERGLDLLLPWWRSTPEAVQRVLTNLCFNLGPQKLITFTHMIAQIQAGSYHTAAASLLSSLYAKQVGDRAKRLASLLDSVV